MSIPRATWTLQSVGSELFSLLFSTSVTLKKVLSILKLQIPFLCVLSCSVMSNSLWPHELYPARLLCPWGFSMLEYWSGLPCSPPGHLPNPGIEPRWDKWFKMSPRNKCRIRGSFSVILAHNSYCYTVHGVLKARMLKWFAIPFSSGPHFVRTLHHDPPVLGGPTQQGSWFHWVRQGCGPCIRLVSFLRLCFSVCMPSDGEG